MPKIQKMVKKTKHGTSVFVRTKFGSYVDESENGMVQQKNACSYKDLLNAGYKIECKME